MGDHREYARLLRGIDLFGDLDRVVLAKLAAHLHPLAFPPSEIILRQGDVGDAFYVIASGTVGVYLDDGSDAVERRLRVLHPGEPFGEMALLSKWDCCMDPAQNVGRGWRRRRPRHRRPAADGVVGGRGTGTAPIAPSQGQNSSR